MGSNPATPTISVPNLHHGLNPRPCERSEAIQRARDAPGLLRLARTDNGGADAPLHQAWQTCAEVAPRRDFNLSRSNPRFELHDIMQRGVGAVEKPADATGRLPDPLLVFNQSQTHIIIAMLAKANAG